MKQQQSGFTLVEIAIVLVIIGLLLGGILKGQEMITNAKVRNMADQGSAVKAAIYAFQDRYRALPGDYNVAASNIPGAQNCAGGRCGNGRIDQNSERGLFWQQLAQAGFINGSFDGANAAGNWTCSSSTCATNTYGGGLLFTFDNEAGGTDVNASELWSGQNIPIGVIAELDRKVDDGVPLTGSFQISDNHSNACSTGAGAASTYNIIANPDATCGGVYRGM
jgi:prepilin-type N-terminal cleavage/methylation domain-containing protein